MSFGSFNENASQPMADINTTPLVDVMLVLLVIFIITAPLFNDAIPIDLPKVNATRIDDKPMVLHVALNGEGELTLENDRISFESFEAHCRGIAHERPNVEMHLKADRATRYERVAELMALAQKAGVEKIAFVTQPE